MTVDHSPGCASFAERLLQRAADELAADPVHDEELMRAVGFDEPPTPEQIAQWQRWAAMTDAEFEAEQGMTP